MKALLFNLVGLSGSWHLIDVSSENALRAGAAPIIFIFFLLSSLLWLIVNFGRNPSGGTTTHVIANPNSYPGAGNTNAESGADAGGC